MRSVMFAIVAAFAAEMQAADVMAWKGAEMSAWTNHVSRFANPRMTAEGIAVGRGGPRPADQREDPRAVRRGVQPLR